MLSSFYQVDLLAIQWWHLRARARRFPVAFSNLLFNALLASNSKLSVTYKHNRLHRRNGVFLWQKNAFGKGVECAGQGLQLGPNKQSWEPIAQ